MKSIAEVNTDQVQDIVTKLAQTLMIPRNMILPFVEFDKFMPELFKQADHSHSNLLAAGHISPDVAIAADRAGLKFDERLGVSPFASDVDALLREPISAHDILYVANPNRITGANFSLADLELLAQAVPSGALIVDEYYYDYYGISAIPLFEMYSNVVVLRSFTASYGIGSDDSGFVIASKERTTHLREICGDPTISSTQLRVLQTALENSSMLTQRLSDLHNESLRIASALSTLGIQCRLSATDFLMFRVGDTKNVGNALARARVPIENFEGYPLLDHYMRYRLQSPLSNDRFVDSFAKMPPEYYRLALPDRRPVTLRRPADKRTPVETNTRDVRTVSRPRVVLEKEELVRSNS